MIKIYWIDNSSIIWISGIKCAILSYDFHSLVILCFYQFIGVENKRDFIFVGISLWKHRDVFNPAPASILLWNWKYMAYNMENILEDISQISQCKAWHQNLHCDLFFCSTRIIAEISLFLKWLSLLLVIFLSMNVLWKIWQAKLKEMSSSTYSSQRLNVTIFASKRADFDTFLVKIQWNYWCEICIAWFYVCGMMGSTMWTPNNSHVDHLELIVLIESQFSLLVPE